MEKVQNFLIGISMLIMSCTSSNHKVHDMVDNSIHEAFIFIDAKKESRKLDDSYNQMLLYISGANPNIDSLVIFCKEKKKSFTDGYFHFIVFFDFKEKAAFPNNPVTGGYMEEEQAKHIKAIYTYNRNNGNSNLDFYENNYWDSPAKKIEI